MFIYKLGGLLFIFVTIIWSFAFYQNDLNPAKMPIYTISNSKKTVVFQNMSHIWSQKFYDKVVENIRKYKNKKFVLFFEWVKPWKKESMESFDKALWVEFDENLYENLVLRTGFDRATNYYKPQYNIYSKEAFMWSEIDWKNLIQTDEKGETIIKVPTNEFSNEFQFIINGFSEDGLLFHDIYKSGNDGF